MKMIQVANPSTQNWTEIFYDGQAEVVNNVIEIPPRRSHWHDDLLMRGFVDLPEDTVPQEETPKKRTRKKADNGNN